MYGALPAVFDRLPSARAVSTDNPDQGRNIMGELPKCVQGNPALHLPHILGKGCWQLCHRELQPEPGLLQTGGRAETEEGMTGKDVPAGGFLRHNSDVLGQEQPALLRSKWVLWVPVGPNTVF